MLKQTFINVSKKYSDDLELIEELWVEIETSYTSKKRYYHTLLHLENLLIQLTEIQSLIEDWDTILFSLYYHDIVYSALSSQNEEKSAEIAEDRLFSLSFSEDKASKCVSQILATKNHSEDTNNDTNLFTDADLSILGETWDNYLEYFMQVRKEYSVYPDIIYKPGRKKVLKHFLNMNRIFKTNYFFEKLEASARKNLTKELELL